MSDPRDSVSLDPNLIVRTFEKPPVDDIEPEKLDVLTPSLGTDDCNQEYDYPDGI